MSSPALIVPLPINGLPNKPNVPNNKLLVLLLQF